MYFSDRLERFVRVIKLKKLYKYKVGQGLDGDEDDGDDDDSDPSDDEELKSDRKNSWLFKETLMQYSGEIPM